MSWLYLLFAVALEITWVVTLKIAQESHSRISYALTAAAYVACLLPLSLATRTIETATSYSL
jgi:multidrug transporter EmrE-like cation transporter